MVIQTGKDRDDRLRSLAQNAFLAQVSEAARLYGWTGDYNEIKEFVSYLYQLRNLPVPNLEPHTIVFPEEDGK